MDIKILPLAITMMAGPQILFSILLITREKPVKASLVYVSAIGLATSIGVTIASLLASSLASVSFNESEAGEIGKIIQIGLVVLLIILSIKTYLNRDNIKQPKWMTSLKSIELGKVFKIGLLIILLMPTDIIVMFTVGTHLTSEKLSLIAALPFLLLTLFIAALPLLAFLLFRKKAETAMPKIRDWLVSNSALVNIGLYIFFIGLILI